MAYSRDPFLETTERDWRERLEREGDQQDTRDGSMADGLDELEIARDSQRQQKIAKDSQRQLEIARDSKRQLEIARDSQRQLDRARQSQIELDRARQTYRDEIYID